MMPSSTWPWTRALRPSSHTPSTPGLLDENILSPYGHVSVSDGGAHTRYLTTSTWPVEFLTYWIRDRQIMSLEQGHYKMSALPGWVRRLQGPGHLEGRGLGRHHGPTTWTSLGFQYDKMVYSHDFPGGERRIIQKPTGLRYTLVNGVVTFEGNDCTGALPGTLLRSRDMVS